MFNCNSFIFDKLHAEMSLILFGSDDYDMAV